MKKGNTFREVWQWLLPALTCIFCLGWFIFTIWDGVQFKSIGDTFTIIIIVIQIFIISWSLYLTIQTIIMQRRIAAKTSKSARPFNNEDELTITSDPISLENADPALNSIDTKKSSQEGSSSSKKMETSSKPESTRNN